MLFNSFEFFVFFPIVTILYFVLPHRIRWLLLLLASCFFYMAFIPVYILVLALTIVVDYFAGMWIERSEGKKKVFFLVMSIISTCAILFVFKYFNFFNANFDYIARLFHWNYSMTALNIILPIGLSFHTFQSMSYVIEVFKGKQKAEHNFGIYSLYVMFFPQLVAGPIERPQNLLHQFYEKHDFEYKRVTDGLKLMLWGLFKKIVIADRLAIVVNTVYNNPADHTGLQLILATVFFAFQIYCDFSGYSDIAIGSAQVMGFKLMDNFNRPYFSASISEFWKRWHISLSTWFRDYLYIPLGGNRVAVPIMYLNLFIVFLVSGLWHGANWTFVIWGALHGFYIVFGLMTSKIRQIFADLIGIRRMPLVHRALQIVTTFILVNIGWVFFRANNISDAWYILTHMFSGWNLNLSESYIGLGFSGLMIAFASIIIMECVHLMQEHMRMRQFLSERPLWLRWAIYIIILMSIVLFGVFENTKFIYFQF